jgi:pimeloyl-ACP methyl ester carboxylesterase
MGGIIATVFAGKYPERTRTVIINCALAKCGFAGRLLFKNWIDVAELTDEGPGSRLFAELTIWEARSKAFMASPEAAETIETLQRVLGGANDPEIFKAGIQAIIDADSRGWLPKISAPALVIGGDEDLMTPWDQGPDGAGMQAIYDGIADAEKYIVPGAGHTTIFDNTDDYNRAILDFLIRHRTGT